MFSQQEALVQRIMAVEYCTLDSTRFDPQNSRIHRRALVNDAREPLRGSVEIDDTWVGGTQAGIRGSRQLKGRRAALVLAAVEKRGTTSGRIRMAVIPDFKATTINDFLTRNVAPGSTIFTDGLKTFTGLDKIFQHIPRTQPLRSELHQGHQGAKSVVPLADRAIGNLQQWLLGTHHGVSRSQLQVYLDEFVFRHNRRRQPMAAFQTLLGLGTARASTRTTKYVAPETSLNRLSKGNPNI
jgi:transposase-like protein